MEFNAKRRNVPSNRHTFMFTVSQIVDALKVGIRFITLLSIFGSIYLFYSNFFAADYIACFFSLLGGAAMVYLNMLI